MPDLRLPSLIQSGGGATVRSIERSQENYQRIIRGGLGLSRSSEMLQDDTWNMRGHEINHERRPAIGTGAEALFAGVNPPGALGISNDITPIIPRTTDRALTWVAPVSGINARELHWLLDSANARALLGQLFAAGSIIFSDGTVLTEDNANLFWDDLNNRLGVGTATPEQTLHVAGELLVNDNIRFESGTGFEATLDHGNTASREYDLPDVTGDITVDITGSSILQRGRQAFVGTVATVVFPTAFGAAPDVQCCIEKTAGSIQAVNVTTAATTTGFTVTRSAAAGSATLIWYAIGA